MRIWIVAACPFPAGRGSQLLIERTAIGLLRRGHSVRLFCHRSGESGRALACSALELRRAGLPGLGRVIGSRPDPLRFADDALLLGALLRAAASREPRPDAILAHNVAGSVAGGVAGSLLGAPVLYLRHSDFPRELSLIHARLEPLARRLDALATRLATRSLELGLVAPALPPPLDPDERPIAPGDGRSLYYEGNLDPYQNPDWLLHALKAAQAHDPQVRLIRAAGPRQRPARADLALLPRSLGGGFPMKLLAYQMAGIPSVCVASGAPGVVDRLDAFVVAGEGSMQQFSRRVIEALSDPGARRRVAASARKRALERCHPDRTAACLESQLRSLTSQDPRAQT